MVFQNEEYLIRKLAITKGFKLYIQSLMIRCFFVLVSESNLEKAKLEGKEAVAKQIKVSLDFEIEQVGTCI